MIKARPTGLMAGILAFALLVGCSPSPTATLQAVLPNLDEPRGLWLRPDGTLCVAEAGRPPEPQKVMPPPANIFTDSGALTCLDPSGKRQRLVEGLPYVMYSEDGTSVGPTAVGELDGNLYLLTAEGYGDLSRKLLRIDPGQAPVVIADILQFAAEGRPLGYIQPSSVAANPYGMIPDPPRRRFLVTDGAAGRVLSVGIDHHIEVYSPQTPDHDVVTGIAWGPDGLAFFASFSEFPHQANEGAIFRIQPDGSAEVAQAGLTAPIALAFDKMGRLYVLEFLYASPDKNPYLEKTGRLLRFERQGAGWAAEGQALLNAIPYPTAMIFGPDESLYISIHGAFSDPGTGAVIRLQGLAQVKPGQPALQVQP